MSTLEPRRGFTCRGRGRSRLRCRGAIIRTYAAWLSSCSSVGLDVVTYDARGHGLSEGRCGVGSTEHLDVASVLSAVAADAPIVVVGVSMGAVAVVSHLAGADAPGKAVVGAVLVSAPSRWRMRPSAVGLLTAVLTRSTVGRWAAARWLGVRIKRGWWPGETPESAMIRIGVPVVVVHGLRTGSWPRPTLVVCTNRGVPQIASSWSRAWATDSILAVRMRCSKRCNGCWLTPEVTDLRDDQAAYPKPTAAA